MTIQRYTVAMPAPHTHLYHVTLEIDRQAHNTSEFDLALPVWTPGSYLVRDYARHVQEFAAFGPDGAPLPWHKHDKTTWRVAAGAAPQVVVHYKVYAFDLTVRTSHLDGSHGYFNPATLCMYLPGHTSTPLVVQVDLPDGWWASTALDPAAPLPQAGGRWAFQAADYDELVDSPFECGTHRRLVFDVAGIPHTIALWGHGNEDEAQLLRDTRRIVEAGRAMFGSLPYRRYLFIVHLVSGRSGGLEHRASVTMQLDRWTFQPTSAYERYLTLTSHEFFHVWNVKRIRPAPLGPFDYAHENYTRELWTMEGVTSYYTALLLVRAGLMQPVRWLERLAERIVTLQSQPGRAVQSLELSSFDAWIKHYRPDENSANSAISYYLKGELVALLLDLELRRQSGGARSLDNVLRLLHTSYPPTGPGFAEQGGYRAAVEAITEAPGALAEFFEHYVAGTAELDYQRAFDAAGLQLVWGHTQPHSGAVPAWTGLLASDTHGRLLVSTVLAGSPAEQAGIYAGDELLALDGFRIDATRLAARLRERRPGDRVTFSLFRQDELRQTELTLAAAPPDHLTVLAIRDPSPAQLHIRAGWLEVWG